MKTLDITRLRGDTPACQTLIHFNNAGCSLAPTPVTTAVYDHLRLEQEIGGYEAAECASAGIAGFYSAFAALLNCTPPEIAFMESATRAWHTAVHAISFAPGDRVLTGQSEYASNYLGLLHLARVKSLALEVIPNDSSGRMDLERFERKLGDDVALVALTHLPSQNGALQPAEEAGRLARERGILYMLDACQSAGQLALDVETLQCDMLVGTGRKFLRGPRGTGFLYVREESLPRLTPPFVDLHSFKWLDVDRIEAADGARRFETFEGFVAGKIGLGVAVNYALDLGLDLINRRVATLAGLLRRQLQSLDGIEVHEESAEPTGIVTFSSSSCEAVAMQTAFRDARINVSIARKANALLDFTRRGLPDVIRASLHYYNTEEEITSFIAAVRAASRP
ncbi:MAG: aminotransferase class V-fold PLP-dependent enzyme [Pseudohongiellaceae bacterium]